MILKKQMFSEWYAEFRRIAKDNDVEWLAMTEEDFPRDAYEDDISPFDAFWDEVSYACEG